MTFNRFKKSILLTALAFTAVCYAQRIEKGERKVMPIDLKHWKVTIPEGKPTSVTFPEIMDYENNEALKKFMYKDDSDESIIFYTYPSGITTANTSYSRSELREQMLPGKDSPNWTFAQGGRMKGVIAMGDVSKDEKGKFHRTIIMQIHGRLTNEQRELIGQDDNNAPPILKIYWDNGKVRVKTKVLKDRDASEKDILSTNAWVDDKGYTFKEKVGFDRFTVEVKVSDGRMEVVLNNKESVVYASFYMKKWGIFENYFKAGNYLITNDKNAFAKVKYYSLEIFH